MHYSNYLKRELASQAGSTGLLMNEPMSVHTSFKVGGPADLFVMPKTLSSLTAILDLALMHDIPYMLIGKGSNLIVSDKGIRGLVISTLHLTHTHYTGNIVTAFCGLELKKLSHSAARKGLSGLEFACGIPGSVGGAVYMNAGAYEGEISQILLNSKVLMPDKARHGGTLAENTLLDNAQHHFSYRYSAFQMNNYVHLCSTFQLHRDNKQKIESRIMEFTRAREEKQPLELPSAGSVFRRPAGYFVGQMIQKCGLRGFRMGDAAISEKHCGFIVNLGKATARDILNLISHVQNEIRNRYGVELQTEVKFVGES